MHFPIIEVAMGTMSHWPVHQTYPLCTTDCSSHDNSNNENGNWRYSEELLSSSVRFDRNSFQKFNVYSGEKLWVESTCPIPFPTSLTGFSIYKQKGVRFHDFKFPIHGHLTLFLPRIVLRFQFHITRLVVTIPLRNSWKELWSDMYIHTVTCHNFWYTPIVIRAGNGVSKIMTCNFMKSRLYIG